MTTMLTCVGISKWFGSTQVLSEIAFSVEAGEIHAVLGENGAGKSTLVKIISGLHRPDSGEVIVGGTPRNFATVTEANNAGVVIIHQEPRIFPDLTVIENMWIDDRTSGWFKQGFRDKQRQRETALQLNELGCAAPLGVKMSELSVADQQLVDVASALRRDLKVLIVDEPTASLTPSEVRSLFAVLRRLKNDGVAIIFIGHRLEEILDISDRVTVLRDGNFIQTLQTAETSEDELVRLMVGRDIEPSAPRHPLDNAPTALLVKGLSSRGTFQNISFEVREGEILGLGGLVGAGRTEVLETIFGVRPRTAGTVTAQNKKVETIQHALSRGIALVPEDRAKNGLILSATIRQNIAISNLSVLAKFGFRRPPRERSLAQRMMETLGIKAAGDESVVSQLSGGNQQKVSLAKWLAGDLKVLLVDEPTRGVDVGAKSEIHALLKKLADEGLAIVVASSDMRELISMSDRIVVMREGEAVGEVSGAEATEEAIIRLAAGVGAV
ncbi:MAG: sugar ABC transporter ATP-binding protein [Actinomycetales bacterium]|nr:sugar ABC transporter ATP-binding protein [Actinomycetales bacterium]